jgi:hypothetical protein
LYNACLLLNHKTLTGLQACKAEEILLLSEVQSLAVEATHKSAYAAGLGVASDSYVTGAAVPTRLPLPFPYALVNELVQLTRLAALQQVIHRHVGSGRESMGPGVRIMCWYLIVEVPMQVSTTTLTW